MGTVSLVAFAVLSVVAAAPGVRPGSVAASSRSGQTSAREAATDAKPRTMAGFRMEGAPQIETVFGDIQHFRDHVDRFYELEDSMERARTSFQRGVHTALAAVAARRRGCPVDDIAVAYRQARDSGDEFRRLGTRLEERYLAIRDLDRLGESAGLTPDYRWKVNRTPALYRRSLRDLEEMRASFVDQLGRELRARGCRPATLLARAAVLDEQAPAPTEPVEPKGEDGADEDVARAPTATFFVDNRSCTDPVSVYVDGTMLGQVAAGTKAAFQSLAGRHSLCLLGGASSLQCGEAGTVRTGFIHSGWTLSRTCGK